MNTEGLCKCNCGQRTLIATKTDARKGHVKGQPMDYLPFHYQKMRLAATQPVTQRLALPGEQPITEQDIINLRIVDDADAADIYDQRARTIEKNTRYSFTELGLICMEVSRRELWKKLVSPETGSYFHSFDAWIFSSLGVSRSSAYSAMKVLGAKDLPADEVRNMPRRNAEKLAGFSSAVQRDPEIRALAKNGSEKELVAEVQKRYPDQHAEPRRAVMASLEDTARSEMEECFTVVRWVYDVESRSDVLANLFAFFLDGPCEREGFTNWTNREAYERAKARGIV